VTLDGHHHPAGTPATPSWSLELTPETVDWTCSGPPVVIHIETDPLVASPFSESWWDVPVAEVLDLDTTRRARVSYERHKGSQQPLV
jgi:3D-(3,5/4)-trihydroxycyclohexane-1,2-dione acylhydrolase (decyclizing)